MPSEKPALALLAMLLALAGCAGGDRHSGTSGNAMLADVSTFKATGEPRQCVPLRGTNLTPAGDRHVMARVNASTQFRNELRSPCPGMNRNRTLVVRATGSQLCDMDVFEVVDPISGISFGVCSLGTFTPVEVPRGVRW